MVKKVLLVSCGAVVLAAGFVVVAALTKRPNPAPVVSNNLLPVSPPPAKRQYLASGQVLGVKKATNSLTVRFDSPPMFRGKIQDVEVACPTSESFVNTITYNIKTKKSPIVTEPQPTNQLLFNIVDAVKKDKDIISGKCASPSCTAISTSCVLTRTVYSR